MFIQKLLILTECKMSLVKSLVIFDLYSKKYFILVLDYLVFQLMYIPVYIIFVFLYEQKGNFNIIYLINKSLRIYDIVYYRIIRINNQNNINKIVMYLM